MIPFCAKYLARSRSHLSQAHLSVMIGDYTHLSWLGDEVSDVLNEGAEEGALYGLAEVSSAPRGDPGGRRCPGPALARLTHLHPGAIGPGPRRSRSG